MADVMYDIHLAQAIASEHGDSVAYYERMLCDAVLRKHGLTQEELDRNLHYFTSRPEEFYKVYERLSKRIDGQGGEAPMTAGTYNTGDTLSIRPDTPRLMLLNTARNRTTLRFDTDTIVKPGDELRLIYRATNIYPEGERNMQAFVRMEYADSVATVALTAGGTGYQQETLPHTSARRLKAISVTFLQNAAWSEKPKLLMLDNIHVLCLRPQKAEPAAPPVTAPADTAGTSAPDAAVSANNP